MERWHLGLEKEGDIGCGKIEQGRLGKILTTYGGDETVDWSSSKTCDGTGMKPSFLRWTAHLGLSPCVVVVSLELNQACEQGCVVFFPGKRGGETTTVPDNAGACLRIRTSTEIQ